ncbi:hypothetical protein D7Z26_13295 [Cohnella endophytica]|uniref:DUF4309 domain-containing protein n=1 Tax=Cohnella endophytica TaxID=2419778 RepID=A0A494XUN6_9BACL|nr:hypothetical protein [Cohnella endophytica]RKP54331.1 hypothetical protein D7Z26_13295 [Cohnella endophytica]
MRKNSYLRLRIGVALLLSISLASCSPSSQTEQPAPTTSEPSATAIASNQPASSEPFSEEGVPPEALLHRETSVPSASSKDPVESQAASTHAVEASNLQPSSKEASPPNDPVFQPKSPSLAGIKLAATDKTVVKHYGMPSDTYLLPDDNDRSIEIWEYDGMSVGFDEQDRVVYVEINSSKTDTGIRGLAFGMDGSEAARLLGIPADDRTNVLTLQVSGGWMKLDLDPDSRKVLSLKLLAKNI